VTHLVDLVYGLAATLASGALFYGAGFALLPRRWVVSTGESVLPVVGASVYVLLCWVAISAQRIPLLDVIWVFVIGLLVLSAVRVRGLVSALRSRVTVRTTGSGLAIFAGLYGLAYTLTPPASEPYLPLAWTGSLGLLTQVRYAQHLLLIGSPALESATFDYLLNPAVSYLLAGFSLAYGQDPLSAAMPARFALIALAGFAALGVCRSTFRVSTTAALAIACIAVTSAQVRGAADEYVLAPIAAISVLLFLLWLTAHAAAHGTTIVVFAVACTSAYVLLLFIDPVTLAGALVMQLITAGVWAVSWQRARSVVVSALVPLIVIALVFTARVQWALDHAPAAGAMTAVGVVLAVVVLATFAKLAGGDVLLDRIVRMPVDRRLTEALSGYVAIALIVGNVALHAVRDDGMKRLPGPWRSLAQLSERPFAELTLRVDRDPDGLLAASTRYFLPTKTIRVIGASTRLHDLPFGMISHRSPLLIQDFGCDGVGHPDVVAVDGVGCTLFAPPSLTLDMRYPFNRTYLAIAFDGMTAREPGGRWNVGRTVELRLLADPGRLPVERPLYVNFSLNPFLPAEVPGVLLKFAWGSGRTGEVNVQRAATISVPVGSGDWSGSRVWSLPVSIDFQDGRTVLFHEVSVSETPHGLLVQ